METVNIAKDFTIHPGPRFPGQGKGSGEVFREKHLKPKFQEALAAGEKLLVELDGVEFGYPTSFLEEAFGGLARQFCPADVLGTLEFVSLSEPMLVEEIRRYIQESTGRR